MFTMMNEMVCHPSILCDLVQIVYQKMCEGRCFRISELSCEFPQISHTVFYEIITVRVGYHHVLLKMGSENAHRCKQNRK
jgi:hypothetical protein